jgi:hemolysin III
VTCNNAKGELNHLVNIQLHQEPRYTLGEEIANCITHGVGTALSVAGLIILIVFACIYGNVWHIVSFSVFGSTLIVLYLSSTLYHAFTNHRIKYIFRIIDHSAIFLLIAGSYTPFLLINLRGAWGWSLFGIIWGLAITGIVVKSVCISKTERITLALYIFMGWLCLAAFKEILKNIQIPCLILLILGGLSYTTGIIFYGWRRLPYNHMIWHIFVLCGSICHFFSVLYCLAPETS